MGKWDSEIGKKYGKLKIDYVFRKDNITWAQCHCDCGGKKTTRLTSLKDGTCTSCGCERRSKLEGQRFGKLTVIKFDHTEKKQAFWLCQCDCGKYSVVPTRSLKSGNTKSCGCESKTQYKKALADREDGTRIGALLRKPGKNNTSGKRGISWNKSRRKWETKIEFKGKVYFLGYFEKFEDACIVREEAEKEIHGNFLKWYISRHPEKIEKILKTRGIDYPPEP